MNRLLIPTKHGEVFVTYDGAETDLDLGHYERVINESLNKHSSVTTGKIYQSVIKKERRGDYLGKTVQVIPHVTNQIKKKLFDVAKHTNPDVVITEIGGTVGDIESLPFIEAIRQMRQDIGFNNTLYIHSTLVPYLKSSNEIKTKPTQHSVKELMSLGVKPDAIVLRSEIKVEEQAKEKIALFCDIHKDGIFEVIDVDIIYKVIENLKYQGIDDYICKHFDFKLPKANIDNWLDLISRISKSKEVVPITIVGKYISYQDSYLSVVESLKHACYFLNKKPLIKWIDSHKLTEKNVSLLLSNSKRIIIPGGFGQEGTNGIILAIKFARENKIPLLGICFGMQLCAIEYAKNVLGLKHATSKEFNPDTKEAVVTLVIEHDQLVKEEKKLRLGLQPVRILENTLASKIYGTNLICERHRNAYEINPLYVQKLIDGGLTFSGFHQIFQTPQICELVNHPFFICVQYHPEYLSRPLKPHPLFVGFVKAEGEANG